MMRKQKGSDQMIRCANTSTGGTVSTSLKKIGTKPHMP